LDSQLKNVLFVPGIMRTKKELGMIKTILDKVQPIFEKNGWHLIISEYFAGQTTKLPLEFYRFLLQKEIEKKKPDAIIGHSMGSLLIQGLWEFTGPIVLIEGPNAGSPWWKLILTMFPIWWKSVKDMFVGSMYLQQLPLHANIIKNNPTLEIHGAFANYWLAKDVFKRLPDVQDFAEFPEIGHIDLLTNFDVIYCVLDFLNKHAPLKD
jgi:hypothetical protein